MAGDTQHGSTTEGRGNNAEVLSDSLNESETTTTATVNGATFTIREELGRTLYEFYHPELEDIIYNRDGNIDIYYMLEGEGEGSYTTSTNSNKYYSTPTRVSAHYEEDDDEFWAIYQDEDEEYQFPDNSFTNNTIAWIFTEPNYKPAEYEFIAIQLTADGDPFYYNAHFTNDIFLDESLIVNFTEPTVEAMIRYYYGNSTEPILKEMLEGVTSIDFLSYVEPSELIDAGIANENGEITISTLDDFKHMPNLERLELTGCEISDISSLSELKKLTRLNLSNNNISDISALSELENLTSLALDGNKIANLPQLSSKNLISLSVSENNLSDINAISNLSSLEYLYAFNNQIAALPDFSGLTALYELSLGENKITDLTPLSNAPNLTRISLGSNNITDVMPLSKIASLEAIFISDNPISDVSSLGQLQNLNQLDLNGTDVTDFSAVDYLGPALWRD